MSADLDRLLADASSAQALGQTSYVVLIDAMFRIAADFARLVAALAVARDTANRFDEALNEMTIERDHWRAIANRLGEALESPFAHAAERNAALGEWRAAKEET